MRADRVIQTIDFHTAGIGMRLVTSGIGRLPGATIGEKRRWFQEHLDHVRTGLCLEPRGHRSLLIAVMTEPVTPAAQFGLFFIYPGGYYVSCGEGTIGAATVAVETGMVARGGGETPVIIDTEAGVVETIARSDGDRVREVTLRWTPSFVAMPEQRVEVEDVGEVLLDIAVGVGNVFALVWGPGQVDPAPCGSGTCARMALFHHRGLMTVGSTYVSRGLLGLDFRGRIGGGTEVDGRRAILPEVTGTAYLTGFSQILFDPEDPLRAGYLLEA